MVEMNLKIEKDSNEMNYISLLRKYTGTSMLDLKKRIDNNEYVIIVIILIQKNSKKCNLF